MFGDYNSLYSKISKIRDYNSLISVLKELKITKSDFLSQYEGADFGFLGSGSYGKVFKLDSKTALKLTTDEFEIKKSKKLKGKKFKNLINIYEIYDLKIKSNQGYLSIIIMELCYSLPQDIKEQIEEEKSVLSVWMEEPFDNGDKYIEELLNNSKLFHDLKNIKTQIQSLGIDELDIHENNFLLKPNLIDICLIDL